MNINMNSVTTVQFITDDEECVSVFIGDALSEIDEEGNVNLQVPVFADGRSGHIYVTLQEARVIERSPVVREALRWALSTRATK